MSVEAVSGSASVQAVAMNANSDPANAKADSALTESGSGNAKSDPPKEQPRTSIKTPPAPTPVCNRNINADVVALAQPIMLNRLGAAIPGGLIFALSQDTNSSGTKLKEGKRPRPLVLRANVGDCLKITFTNNIPLSSFPPAASPTPSATSTTSEVSIHVQGMEWIPAPVPSPTPGSSDGSFVGLNNSSLASVNPAPVTPLPSHQQTYYLYAKAEGTFLLYTMGDTSSTGNQLIEGLFGALNVQPAGAEWYRSQVTADDLAKATYNANKLPSNATLNAGCTPSATCTLSVTGSSPVQVKKTASGLLNTLDGHPLINYNATIDGTPDGTPILKMLDAGNNIVHSDLTAIITGPNAGRFPGAANDVNAPEPPCNAENNGKPIPPSTTIVNPLFCKNPASPDRKQPYREITIIYHGALSPVATQAFPVFNEMFDTLLAGQDSFAINYGTGGIGAEVYANRIGVGPMGDCVDCKFEEFFLSSWSVGDPAMLVDRPANANMRPPLPPAQPTPPIPPVPLPCTTADFQNPSTLPGAPICANARQPVSGFPYTLAQLQKATRVYYPDDPSNVYHSYINDHVKFRILHGGRDVTHVHHQHAHQWLQSPNSDEGSYLDSQMISPGASYTLEMVYNGSGNRNKVVGDSIFHCHFYPHFAAGMWAMWRTHDVFESGTELVGGVPKAGSRALPDGEIIAGTPIPAVVPMPTLPMAPLPGYAQIQNNVKVEGIQVVHGGQIVVGGACLSNTINNLPVTNQLNSTNTCASDTPTTQTKYFGTVVGGSFVITGQQQTVSGTTQAMTGVMPNPGYPFFIAGIAGARPSHPPMDFACAKDASGKCLPGTFLDGGLPRHLIASGSIKFESHDDKDWSKDLATANAVELPEDGTDVEKSAMAFFGKRCYPTFLPNGTPGSCPSSNSIDPQSTLNTPPTGFILNGLPRGPQQGAPFADPGVDDNGVAVNVDPVTNKQQTRIYKAAAIQANVTFNKQGWHFPQQRMLTLWQDAQRTIDYTNGTPGGRPPEPLFFRGNSGDILEYWHTNLVPNYYLVDDFQVRTPTDILGQHIHLVKFDVTSSDGAANGFNYEDGTFSPEEVQELIHAINAAPFNGLLVNGSRKQLQPTLPPADIFNCALNPSALRCKPCPEHPTPANPQCQSWMGAQTTIQRWYLDPLLDNSGKDRTLRTVFTHDHFGPSTHQQAGLYAGLLVEPKGSSWRNSEDGAPMGRPANLPPVRPDGGPTSWKADILTRDMNNKDVSYREFALEFQDLQLAYQKHTLSPRTAPSADPRVGWIDTPNALNPPSTQSLITTGIPDVPAGTQSVNYRNEPVPFRLGGFSAFPNQKLSDLSYAFDNSVNQAVNSLLPPAMRTKPDPMTPLLRAYQNDNVQIRVLVGAHVFAHQFNLEGPTWFAEPSWKNSGYRSAQAMGLSEHFELLFKVPSSSAPLRPSPSTPVRKCPDGMSQANCVDYLYSPSLDEEGLINGLWGLFRAYDPTKIAKKLNGATTLQPLPNNPIGPSANVTYATCPTSLTPPAVKRVFNITAVTAEKALALQTSNPGVIVFNDRLTPALRNTLGIMYVRTEDLIKAPGDPKDGTLKPGVPVEPLILRANAGDCIEVNLTNAVPLVPGDTAKTAKVLQQDFKLLPPFDSSGFPHKVSRYVGLHPQLLSYDAARSSGVNVGWNSLTSPNSPQLPDQAVPFGKTIKYQWYAGKIDRASSTSVLTYTPVEFGSLNLFPSDYIFQHPNGLFGAMIIEPQGSTWKCGEAGNLVDCEAPAAISPPTTRASATITLPDSTTFREFALMISDAINITFNPDGSRNSSAVNYRTEPWKWRYTGNVTQDFSCMLSNQLILTGQQDPKTPILTAAIGDKVRFRMMHPFGTGTSQVFTVHGHVWQRNPYQNDSREIGDNNLSQWLGSRDNHGSTDHFELVIDKAGGERGQAGDYLYTVFVPNQARLGAWGIFRVGSSSGSPQGNAACPPVLPPPGQVTPPPKKDGTERFIRQPLNTGGGEPRP
jgi:hypothetical protein